MKNFLFFLVSLLSLPALGCIGLKGKLSINGEEIKINQKVDQDTTYSFTSGAYIVNLVLPSGQKEGTHLVDIKVDLKGKASLTRVSNGQILVKDGQEATMTSVDQETKERFSYQVTVRNI